MAKMCHESQGRVRVRVQLTNLKIYQQLWEPALMVECRISTFILRLTYLMLFCCHRCPVVLCSRRGYLLLSLWPFHVSTGRSREVCSPCFGLSAKTCGKENHAAKFDLIQEGF